MLKNEVNISNMYFLEVSRHKRLSLEEEKALYERISAGDDSLRELLVLHNLPLAFSYAKRFLNAFGHMCSLEDLIQDANIGLINAARDFDPSKGARFSTYAVYHVRQVILRTAKENGSLIRLPEHFHPLLTKVFEAESLYFAEHGKHPDFIKLAEITGLSEKKVLEALSWKSGLISFDEEFGNTDGAKTRSLIEAVSDKDYVSPKTIMMAKETLAELEKDFAGRLKSLDAIKGARVDVFIFRYSFDLSGETRTIADVVESFGLSINQVKACLNFVGRGIKLRGIDEDGLINLRNRIVNLRGMLQELSSEPYSEYLE